MFEDINFEIRKGEVLAVAGLMGAGRTEVAQAIFGYRKKSKVKFSSMAKKCRLKAQYKR